jgi:hypothetical protein
MILEQYRKRLDRQNFNLEKLRSLVQSISPEFAASDSVSYIDTDGDEIQIKNDEDLMEARVVMTEKNPPRKTLDICVKFAAMSEEEMRQRRREDRKDRKHQRCRNLQRHAGIIGSKKLIA